ncbi:MAG: S8 family serine peptidase [Bacteroidales bacterium]|jgi:hypothetical protein|nr:S8 family serine peptidase [Bacteroidales bacterium]
MQKLFLLLAISIFCFTASGQEIKQETQPQEYLPDIIYVRYKQSQNKKSTDYASQAKRILTKNNVQAKVKSMSLFKNEVLERTVRIKADNPKDLEEIIKQFQENKDVEMIERVPIHQTYGIYPNDSLYGTIDNQPLNWHLTMIGAEQAWALQQGTPNIKIAVIDNAIWGDHEDLQIAPENLYNVSTETVGSADPPVPNDVECTNSDNCLAFDWAHGTHCAGNVGAITNNGKGVASLGGGVTVMGISCQGSSPNSMYDGVSGITWAVENGAKVLSLSWGGGGYETLEEVISSCIENGIVVVAASGNNSTTNFQYPAAYPGVISVASLDSDTALSSFSNHGTWVTIAAPGGTLRQNGSSFNSILSTTYNKNITYKESGYNALNGKYYDGMAGTSMACPIVASLCGLLLSKDTTLSVQEIRDILIATSVPINNKSNKKIFPGSGMINSAEALQVIGHTIPAPRNVVANVDLEGVIKVTWDIPTPDSSVFYRIYKDGILYRDTFDVEEFYDTDIKSNNYYIYGVSAVYANGEESFHTTGSGVLVPNYFYVRANILPDSNAGTVTGAGTFRSGYNVTLTANASNGFHFKEWSFYGTIRSTDSIYTFALDKNQTLNAVFEETYTSIENVNNTVNIKIFPNPTTDELNFTTNIKAREIRAEVYTENGKLLLQEKFFNLKSGKLSLKNFAKGLYFLHLSAGSETQTIKFIKH